MTIFVSVLSVVMFTHFSICVQSNSRFTAHMTSNTIKAGWVFLIALSLAQSTSGRAAHPGRKHFKGRSAQATEWPVAGSPYRRYCYRSLCVAAFHSRGGLLQSAFILQLCTIVKRKVPPHTRFVSFFHCLSLEMKSASVGRWPRMTECAGQELFQY